jgi:hypothetical protein
MQEKVKGKKSKWIFANGGLLTGGVKSFAFCLFTSTFFCFSLTWAQDFPNSDRLFSPSVGQKFYEIAYELANSEDVNESQAEQAIVFLSATAELDGRANYILPDMIKLACRHSERDYSELVSHLLANYVDEFADLEVVRKAVRYLLEQLNSREERENLLAAMLNNFGGKNKVLDSELATLLGLLIVEKADFDSATPYFMLAYNNNKYNRLAFEKLAELVPEQIEPAMYLEHLRLILGENPLDMEAALAFAQYAERLQLYQTAADVYEYCVDLFRFLNPSQPLPSWLYLSRMISNYNTQRNQHKCLQIASEFRQSGRFNLLIEAIAGKAAAKIGDTEQADRILRAAEGKIDNQSSIPVLERSEGINNQSIAWFYCFALPDADKAINWANKAYSAEPNSATAASLLAYSLVMNGQTDWAKMLIDTPASSKQGQIAALTLAQIQLAQEQRDSAIKTLKSAIAKDPGSLEAERAKEILTLHGGEYIPPVDLYIVTAALRDSFGQRFVPEFVSPGKMISVQLNVRGEKFSYGGKFGGAVVITNNSLEPLVISNNGLLRGSIRIDADISGDLNEKIANLVSVKVRTASLVKPGQSLLIPVCLATSRFRQVLLTYPQASLDIEFTVFVDPVITDEGKVTNRLVDLEPARLVVKRPGVNLTGKYLRNRLDSLSRGRQNQKNKIAQLFIGLLMEQHAMANHEPLYKFMYADWMSPLLKSALMCNLADDDWVVKAHTMAAMLSLPMDYELLNAVSENLNDTRWPIRMMALFLLAKDRSDNFGRVLDWAAKYDSNKLVRDMAVALGAAEPQQQESQATQADSNTQTPANQSR